MNFEVGSIVEGKVTGIKPFGAFVALNDNVQGLVHISEVSHGFVKDINDALSVGDVVSVKILSVDEDSKKISLSIRQTQEAPAPAPKKNAAQVDLITTTKRAAQTIKTLTKVSTLLKRNLKIG